MLTRLQPPRRLQGQHLAGSDFAGDRHRRRLAARQGLVDRSRIGLGEVAEVVVWQVEAVGHHAARRQLQRTDGHSAGIHAAALQPVEDGRIGERVLRRVDELP